MSFKDTDGNDVDETIEAYDDDTVIYTMTSMDGKQTIVVEDYGRVSSIATPIYNMINLSSKVEEKDYK